LHTFSYRSKKDTAFLEARLSYRITGNQKEFVKNTLF